MTSTRNLLREAARLRIYSRHRHLESYFAALFRDVQLDGASVLDVGGGAGVAALYAATKGACRVVCLEPELDGSSGGAETRFRTLSASAGITNAEFVASSLAQYATSEQFNVVLLHNTINHLDEAACIRLAEDAEARTAYEHQLAPLRELTSSNGWLIVADASPQNVYAVHGLRNPLAPTIEWHKHQPPEVWIEVLRSLGFTTPVIRWTPLDVLGRLGLLLANRQAAYYHRSHFVITMRRPPPESDVDAA